MRQIYFSGRLILLLTCLASLGFATDKLTLQNKIGTGEVTALISGQVEKWLLPFIPFWERLECKTIQRSSHSATIPLGKNFVPPGDCPSKLVVFSEKNAVVFMHPFAIPEVTPSGLDEIPVDLAPVHKMKITVWVAACESAPGVACDETPQPQGRTCQESSNIICQEARQEIEIANKVLKNQRTGIELEIDDLLDISCGAKDAGGCQEVQSICPPPEDRVFFANDMLNIYYVRSGYDQNCNCTAADLPYCIRNGIAQTIYVTVPGSSTKQATHEVGHALSLGHLDRSRNVMKADGNNNRCRFFDGQRFRMSVGEVSLLNHAGAGGPRDPENGTCRLPENGAPSGGGAFICPNSSAPWDGEILCDETM